MSSRLVMTGVALLVLVLAAAVSSAATWVWSDGDFSDDDWDIVSWYPPLDSGGSDATFALTIGHGGNPGGLRATGVDLGDGPDDGAMIVHLNNQWTLDPATGGAILNIDGGGDFMRSTGGPSRICLAVEQAGEIFVHVLNPEADDADWTTYYHPTLTAADFVPIDPGATGEPDFSATGSTLTFGFATGQVKPHGGGLTDFYQFVDNVLLVMTTSPVSGVGPDMVGVLQAPDVAPNPFNPSTTISFEMPAAGSASVRVYDLAGRLVKELAAREFGAGLQTVTWRGKDSGGRSMASGVYTVVLEVGSDSVSRRITLAK